MTMKSILATVAFMLLAASATMAAPFEFFPFDSGVGRGKPEWTPDRQAEILKELGFDGIGYNYVNPAKLAEWLKALDARGRKLYSIYVASTVGKPAPNLEEALKLLQGRDTIIWLNVARPKNAGDKTAPEVAPGSLDNETVELVRSVCAQAKKYGVKVALYGHFNLYIETAEDGLRIFQKAGCDNLGISMNLCHELSYGNQGRLTEIINKCVPHLMLVSVNGADTAKKSILRLDQGDFDVASVIKDLKAAGYKGPVGLQCYMVPGEVRENLTADIGAWKKIVAKVFPEEAKP